MSHEPRVEFPIKKPEPPKKHGPDWGIWFFVALIFGLIAIAAAAPKFSGVEDMSPKPGEQVTVLNADGTHDYTYVVGANGDEIPIIEHQAPLATPEPDPASDFAADPVDFTPLSGKEIDDLLSGKVAPTPAQQARLRTMVINQLIADVWALDSRVKQLEAKVQAYLDEPAPTCKKPEPSLLQAPVIAPPIDSPFILDENGEVQECR